MQTLVHQFGQVLLPLVTPFDDQERLDLPTLVDLVDMVIENHYADSLVVAGTTGEFYALTHDERLRIFQTVKEANRGRLPLIAGTGAVTTREAIAYSREAESLGYDCAMVISPYFQGATQKDLYHHFASVARSTSLPVVLYNIPLFTAVNIEVETLGRLARDLPNILGSKEQAGVNATQLTRYKLIAPDHFTIYCADDTMVLQTLPQGAVGVVSGGSHVLGDVMKRMIQSYLKGDVQTASALYVQTYPFFRALSPNDRINPIALLKSAITLASGIDVGVPRLPCSRPTESEIDAVRQQLRALGKLPLQSCVSSAHAPG